MTLYVINRAEEWFNEKLRKAIDVTVDRKGLILKINFFHKINLLGSGGGNLYIFQEASMICIWGHMNNHQRKLSLRA